MTNSTSSAVPTAPAAGPPVTPAAASDDHTAGLFPHGRTAALVVVLIGQFMGIVDALVVNVALPTIGVQLHVGTVGLQLVVAGYVAAFAVTLLAGARLGALLGQRRAFGTGLTIFTLASLACGLAPTIAVLVGCRVAQGIGAGLLIPQVVGLIQLGFRGQDRARAMSGYGVVLSVGAVAGLLIGGLLVGADVWGLGWRPVFLVNVPVGVGLLVAAVRCLPGRVETSPVDHHGLGALDRRGLDLRGLALNAAAVGLVITAIVWAPRLPDGLAWTAAGLALGTGFLIAFLAWQRRCRAIGRRPLFDPAVLRAAGFGRGLITLVTSQIVYGGLLFFYTLHLHLARHAEAIGIGLAYLPMAVTFGLVGLGWRRLPVRWWRWLPPVGMALVLAGSLLLTLLDAPSAGHAAAPSLALIGVGLGLTVGPTMTSTLAAVPAEQSGDASGALAITVQLGQAVGVAVLGATYASANPSSVGPRSDHLVVVGMLMAAASAVSIVAAVSRRS